MTTSNSGSKYYFNEGIQSARMADYESAVKNFDEAIALDPGNAEAHRNRGKAVLFGGSPRIMKYVRPKHYRKAIADFSRAIVLNPNNAVAYLDRGMAFLWRGEGKLFHRWGKGDYTKAIADFSHAIELGRNDAQCFRLRGIAYLLLKDPELIRLAYSDLNQAIKLEPTGAASYWWRRYCFAQMGNEAAAEIDYKKAIELDPKLRTNSVWKEASDTDVRFAGFEWPE